MPGVWIYLLDCFSESIPSDPLRPLTLPIPRPVNTERLPTNFLLPYKPPEPTVQTLVTIIAHHEISALRHGHRPEIVARIDRTVDDPWIDPLGEGLILKHNPVHQHGFIAKLDRIARSPHNSFNKVFFLVFGKPEHNDISPLRFAEFYESQRCETIYGGKHRLKLALAGPLNTVGLFADQDMIPD